MHELFERLIADFHERPLPRLTRRDVRLPALRGKVDAVVGMRRTGKTSLLLARAAELHAAGVPREGVLYVNFDDERLLPLEARELDALVETYYRLYPARRAALSYLMLDEIQNVPGWERWIRRLLDTEAVQVAVTGSSARLLGREIATSLRGRALTTEVYPFSFREALRHRGMEPARAPPYGGRTRSRLDRALREHLAEGGFPEVQGLDPALRVRVLQEYVDVAVLRDVAERHRVSNLPALRALVRQALAHPAGELSITRLHRELRSRGLAVSRDTLHEYFAYLEDAYLLSGVTLWTRSERARRVNPRKVYPVDTGLALAHARRLDPDWGRLLESWVFLELRRRGYAIGYYRTRSSREVDFLAEHPAGGRRLVQAAWTLEGEGTRARALEAAAEAMRELRLREGEVVTWVEEETVEAGRGRRIRVVPAARWALELD